MEAIYKCTGYKKHSFTYKNTDVDSCVITFYGYRDFNDFESNDECYGKAAESKTIFESDFDLIPNGKFEINKSYLIRYKQINGKEYIMSIKAAD